jgi:hypothetical protein
MNKRSAEIAAISELIDKCFSVSIWCEEFVPYLHPEDMIWGSVRAAELVSDAVRLQSLLAFQKLDDILTGVKAKPDDLVATDVGIDVPAVLGGVGEKFLSTHERNQIDNDITHLAKQSFPDPSSEVDLIKIFKRSIPVFSRLVAALRIADEAKEATAQLEKTDELIRRGDAF